MTTKKENDPVNDYSALYATTKRAREAEKIRRQIKKEKKRARQNRKERAWRNGGKAKVKR